MINSIIQLLTPPLLYKFVRTFLKNDVQFRSYSDALSICQIGGYQNEHLVDVIVKKNLIFRRNLELDPCFDLTSLRTLIALNAMEIGQNLSVVDFGGGGGTHYAIARTVLGSTKSIRWNVVETPALSMNAQVLANSELNFFNDLDSASTNLGNIDLVFTSSALQYCADPLLSLSQLVDLNARYLFITRTPFLGSSNSVITTQQSKLSSNGPGPLPSGYLNMKIKYPITYVSREKVETLISEKYDIHFRIEEGSEGFSFKNEKISIAGYFCVLKQV